MICADDDENDDDDIARMKSEKTFPVTTTSGDERRGGGGKEESIFSVVVKRHKDHNFVAFEIDSRTTVDEVFERCVNDAKRNSFCVETDDETDRRGGKTVTAEDGKKAFADVVPKKKRDENNGDDARRDADDDGNVVNGSEFGRRAKTRGEGEDDET